MAAKVVEFRKVAKATIASVLQQFIDEAGASSKPSKPDREQVIELFIHSINGYGHQSLSEDETKLFEKYYNLEGAKHKEFCELFGPDKIIENVGEFLDYFLVRKVMSSAAFLKKAGTTMKALCQWLESKGYAGGEEAEAATQKSADAAKNLPKAEKAGRLLLEQACERFGAFGTRTDESGYMDITRMEPGKLWVTPIGGKQIGPIEVSVKVTELLEVGWEINLGLVKSRGKWLIGEVGCIYPH